MPKRFIRWLRGDAPQEVGAYCGEAGVCLVHAKPGVRRRWIYQPPTLDGDLAPLVTALQKLEAMDGVTGRDISLAVAIGAEDVFTRSLTVPRGLTDAQLEQVATIEAVANLPVPPEEICLDFIRMEGDPESPDESVSLLFCRRERVDEILSVAESIPVQVSAIDRDAQAVHDALAPYLSHAEIFGAIGYPFGILLTELSPRFVICLDALTFEIYPVCMPRPVIDETLEGLGQQLVSAWLRSRMIRGEDGLSLRLIVWVGEGFQEGCDWLSSVWPDGTPQICRVPMLDLRATSAAGEVAPPDEIFLIAAGMAERQRA